MRFNLLSSVLLAAVTVVSASPIDIESRQSSGSTCGSTYYSAGQLSDASDTGYSYYSQGSTAGSSSYPHQYNNYEGFNFPVSGPYQEFPIMRSGEYSGGSPGADRVIFNTQGQYAGSITHTGASGNNFVACSDTN